MNGIVGCRVENDYREIALVLTINELISIPLASDHCKLEQLEQRS